MNAVLKALRPETFQSTRQGGSKTGRSGISGRTQDIEISVLKFQQRSQDPISSYNGSSTMIGKDSRLSKMDSFSPDAECFSRDSDVKFDEV